MADGIRARLLRWMKVPAEPAPPPGGGVTTFRASHNYYRYTIALWLLKQASALFGLYISYQFLQGFMGFRWLVYLELVAILGFVAQLPFSFALLKMNFEMRWYMLSDRSLRIREGVLTVHEQTMAFANIQNISIRQNPLQRLCGIATVVVRAAGGGAGATSSPYGESGKSGSHEATFEGVDNAEEIRSVIRERIRLHRDAGLGDPDDPAPRTETPARRTAVLAPGPDLSGAIAAAERVLAEARALRRAVL
jgi:uncharacterized membrane protein YdbT with pleckstrin-like domain